MLISIIIPTSGSNTHLERCLRSCFQQNIEQHEVEFIIVQNGSDPYQLSSSLAHSPFGHLHRSGWQINFLSLSEANTSQARNFGITHAKGEVLGFLDDDCILHNPDHLQTARAHFSQTPWLAALGGPYLSPDKSSFLGIGYNLMVNLWIRTGLQASFSSQNVQQTIHLPGGNFFVRTSVIQELLSKGESIFSPHLPWGGEETELLYRLNAHGFAVMFSPALSIEHGGENSLRKTVRRAFCHGVVAARALSGNCDARQRRALSEYWQSLGERSWRETCHLTTYLLIHWPFFFLGRWQANLARRLSQLTT